LTAESYEGSASIGGSFASDRIEDYYLTPWDLGYGSFVRFDHDFIGREALEKMASGPHRKKVTLAVDSEDVSRAIASQFDRGDRAKYMEFPLAIYAMHPYDRVTVDGKTVGLSTWVGYSSNERRMLTLAIVDPAFAEPGERVKLVWGEENGGTRKPGVERHAQFELNATVSPAPYAEVARKTYVEGGWRKVG
jgi:syringate O-demethylase